MSEQAGLETKRDSTKNDVINVPLNDMNYKQLQNIAKSWNLPANLKYVQMRAMLMAKQIGDETSVLQILNEHREQRFRRRSTRPLSLVMEPSHQGKTKRRKFLRPFRFQDFVYHYPHTAGSHYFNSSSGNQHASRNENKMDEVNNNNTSVSQNHIENSTFSTTKMIIESSPPRSETPVHSTQPLLHSLLHETPAPPMSMMHSYTSGSSLNLDSGITTTNYETPTGALQNFYSKHPTWPSQVEVRGHDPLTPYYSDLATSTRDMSAPTYDNGVDPLNLQPLKNSAQIPQAHDLSIKRHSLIPSSYQPVSLYSPQFSHYNIFENSTTEHSPALAQPPAKEESNVKKLASALEFVLNMKLENLPSSSIMPRTWTMANTCTYQCYNTPLCSSTASMITSDVATTSLRSMPEYNKNPVHNIVPEEHRMDAESMILPDDPWLCNDNYPSHTQPQAGFPNFRHNNQLSYPLIYKYVASTEEQLREQENQDSTSTGTANTNWNSELENRPQASSTPNDTRYPQDLDLFPPVPEVPQLDDAMLEIIHDQYNKEQEQQQRRDEQKIFYFCCNKKLGCNKSDVDREKILQHEVPCEFQNIRCFNSCSWQGRLKKLAAHLRVEHRNVIVTGSESSHSFSLHEVRARQNMFFLRETNRRLFVLCVHCYGHLLFATMQFIPPLRSEKAPTAKASLEIIGKDGRPHSWRGKVRPIYEPLSTLRATEQCLTIDPAIIGAIAGSCIIIHTKISFCMKNNKHGHGSSSN